MNIGDKHPREELYWTGFEYVPAEMIEADRQQEAVEGLMAQSEEVHQAELAMGMDDETRRELACHVHGVFANPNATSAEVLEAYIGMLALNDRIIYTASGELGVHLSAAVEALRAVPAKPQGRFLGMPTERA